MSKLLNPAGFVTVGDVSGVTVTVPGVIATGAASVGCFTSAPATVPTVTGSRGGNTALAGVIML